MRNKWVAALGAGALALVLAASTFDTAEARRSGGFGGRSFVDPSAQDRASSLGRASCALRP
jgi:hypothetical protein